MKRLNVEIKARSSEHARIRALLHSKAADFKGTDRQLDTYFRTNAGRLKLREGNIENYLVLYERENEDGPKQSRVMLLRPEPGSPLKEMLTKALGVLAVVDKQREIYFIDNVKFHLDVVAGLGSFVEIEAIDTDGSIGSDTLLAQCRMYINLLGIRTVDLVACSYSDLVLAQSRQPPTPG